MKICLEIICCIALATFISCNVGEKYEKTRAITIKDGPTLEQFLDSLKIDSIKYHSKIDSIFLIKNNDSSLTSYLDQCYWPFHARTIKTEPIFNKQGDSTAPSFRSRCPLNS